MHRTRRMGSFVLRRESRSEGDEERKEEDGEGERKKGGCKRRGVKEGIRE